MVHVVTDCGTRGIRIALASASKNAPTHPREARHPGLFDAIIDGNAVSRAKPDPEVFLPPRALDRRDPSNVVFEDAVAGVEAGRRAGMLVVGIGDRGVLRRRISRSRNSPRSIRPLLTGARTPAEMLIREEHYNPENDELNGSEFLLSNGYMGYRGTLDEFTREERVACTLAGLYDRAAMPGASR